MAIPPPFQAEPPGEPPTAPPASDPPEKISVIRAVKFLLSDREHRKANWPYAALLSIIPVVGRITLMGWQAEAAQRLVRRHPTPLPKFDFKDLTHYLLRGLVPFLVEYLAVLPIPFLWFVFMMIGTVPIEGARAAGYDDLRLILLIVWMLAGWCLFFGYQLVFVNAILIRAELSADFGQTLKLGAVFRYAAKTWKRSFGYGLLLGVISVGLTLCGFAALYVGVYFALPLISFGSMHLRYQIYAAYLREGGEPIPLKEPQPLPSESAVPGH
ncbi:MAG: DUF4013 domain-containing protein [Polyangiaceae bacterium]